QNDFRPLIEFLLRRENTMPTEPYNQDQGGGSPPLPPKFLYRDPSSGLVTEAFATDGLTSPPSAYTIVSTNADGTIDPSLLPPTGASYTGTAGEALSAGMFVYIDDDGSIFAASAGASPSVNGSEVGPNEAIGYIVTSAAQGDMVSVYFGGIDVAAVTADAGGLIVGKRTYLDTSLSNVGG